MRCAAARRPTALRSSTPPDDDQDEAEAEVQADDAAAAALPLPEVREFSLQQLRQELLSIRELLAP